MIIRGVCDARVDADLPLPVTRAPANDVMVEVVISEGNPDGYEICGRWEGRVL